MPDRGNLSIADACARRRRLRRVTSAAALLTLVAVALPARAQTTAPPSPGVTRHTVGRLEAQPLAFEEQRGHAGADVTFVSRGKGYSLALTGTDAVLAVNRRLANGSGNQTDSKNAGAPGILRMHLAGASGRDPIGLDVLPSVVYHVTEALGPLRAQKTFGRVKYESVYPGIDVVYHGDAGQLEFDFLVAPQADGSRILLAFSGAEKIGLTSDGDLALRAGDEQVLLNKPVAYQDVDGVRRDVAATFVVHPDSTARIALGPYDRSLPLVIDPTITFASYFGSDLDDSLLALETDALGNVYTFGTVPAGFGTLSTPSTHFFGTMPFASAPNDCYVGKLVPSQNGALSYSWLAIFHDSRRCEAMTVAPSGEVFVARTQFDERVAIDVISDTGGLTLARRFDLPQLASATHLRVNGDGHLYVVGGCSTEDFPGELWPLPNGFQPGPAGLPSNCDDTTGPNADNSQHLLVIANDLGNVIYGSFFGFGSSQIEPTALELDPNSRRAYIAGSTITAAQGHTLITTSNALQPQPGDSGCDPNIPPCGTGDAFLIVVNPALSDGATLEYASYFGGQGREYAVAMTLDVGSPGTELEFAL